MSVSGKKKQTPNLQQDVDETQVEEQIEVDPVVEDLTKQLLEKDEQCRRVLADYDNLVKRTKEDRVKSIQFASAVVLEGLLEPMDHLEMAADHLKDQGLTMVVGQFRKVFEENGVEEMDVLGKQFDPHTMEAVETVEGEENIIQGVRSKGYFLHGNVLRHAKVIVGKGI